MMKLNRRVIFGVTFLLTVFLIIRSFFDLSGTISTEEIRGLVSVVNRVNNEKTEEIESQKCYYDSNCALPQMLFRIQSETESAPPFACLNDIRLFDVASIQHGINIAVLNGSTGDIISKSVFDVRASDEKLMRWMTEIPAESVIVAASFGDVGEHVSRQARQIFGAFGALKIDNWRSGNAFTMIGQRGIAKGEAYETLSALNENRDTEQKLFERCFELPIAETKAVNLTIEGPSVHRADESKLEELGAFEADLTQKKNVDFGSNWKNCGMEKACSEDSISIYVFSGEHKNDHPQMCIGGRMLFDKDLNQAGRGLNMAIMEPKTGRVTAVAHFDTYEDESHSLEEWLDAVPTGYIVVVVSFDEASNMLSDMARRIFYEMGSSMIDRLKFRASWYFVGQKGMGAYTPFEDLNIPAANNWATPIKSSFCLPKSLNRWAGRKGESVTTMMASSSDVRNLPKRHFCAKYDRHEEFCGVESLDAPVVPKLLRDDNRLNDPIFNVPILVASGLAPDSLRTTLQSLMNQEGINTQMVLVTYDKEYTENAELAALFHVKSVAIAAKGNYNNLLFQSLSNAFSVFPEAQSIIVIEEDVKLSDDWLLYFSQILDRVMKNKNIDFALAFNPNGFEDTSGSGSTIYQISSLLPIGSYILKRDLYDNHIRLREFCCVERGNWELRRSIVLVPALSRISIRADELEKKDPLFKRSRVESNSSSIVEPDIPTNEKYALFLKSKVDEAKVRVQASDIIRIGCEKWKKSINLKLSPIFISYSKDVLERVLDCLGYYYTTKIAHSNKYFRFSLNRTVEVVLAPGSDDLFN